MPSTRVTTPGEAKRKPPRKGSFWRRHRWFILAGGLLIALAAAVGWKVVSTPPAPTPPPEADRILEAQKSLSNFGILIPAYLPNGFDRAHVEIQVGDAGPSGEPSVQLTYRSAKASLFMRQWVPANRDLETLAGSRPIQTTWGKGWLLTQTNLVGLWVDVGQLRVSMAVNSREVMSREQLVLAAETLGLASDLQVYSFTVALPTIQSVAPPPPFEVPLNAQGVQEFNLTITPGGYSPMRVAVKKGVPVKLVFRAVGQVGCGDWMSFPADPVNPTSLLLQSLTDVQVLEFTPQMTGDFAFHCSHNTFRGILTVRE